MATTNDIKQNKLQATDNEERDGFIEYCKYRTCERMEADHAEELDDADIEKMRVIAIESRIEWRGFTDEMKMFWIERGSVKATLIAWSAFMKENNVSVPSVTAVGPTPTPTDSHSH
ncbi:hypothetical protein BGZ74_003411 [Mortierella antarctica]|nr:hypothetical protein BGZ74_003411 [Mortierella antarctica]KAG0356424.1 hypothetical protein BG005_004642 [Podila minutissima]